LISASQARSLRCKAPIPTRRPQPTLTTSVYKFLTVRIKLNRATVQAAGTTATTTALWHTATRIDRFPTTAVSRNSSYMEPAPTKLQLTRRILHQRNHTKTSQWSRTQRYSCRRM